MVGEGVRLDGEKKLVFLGIVIEGAVSLSAVAGNNSLPI